MADLEKRIADLESEIADLRAAIAEARELALPATRELCRAAIERLPPGRHRAAIEERAHALEAAEVAARAPTPEHLAAERERAEEERDRTLARRRDELRVAAPASLDHARQIEREINEIDETLRSRRVERAKARKGAG